MAATLTQSFIDCSPGNTVTLTGSDLSGATLALQNQGLLAPAPLAIVPTSISATAVSFVVPDGCTSAPLILTAGDATQATVQLQIVTQYLQASAYALDGEGTAKIVAGLQAGEVDAVLRDASAVVDGIIGSTTRLLQVQEDHPFRESRKIWPYRNPRNRIPLISLDALTFITSNAIQTQFNVSGSAPDVYVSKSAGYFDVQAYAVGNAILLGAIQTIGFSANRWSVIYTAGYGWQQFPRELRKATAIVATEMLGYGNIFAQGLGGLSRIKQGERQYDRRNEEFAVPAPVMSLLSSFISRSFA